MKYLSFLIILVVMSIIGWTTDTCLQSIFVTKGAAKATPPQLTLEVAEAASFTDKLDSILGK